MQQHTVNYYANFNNMLVEGLKMEYSGGKKSTFSTSAFLRFSSKSKAAEAARDICNVYGKYVIRKRAAQKWFEKFKKGDMGLEDTPRSGRPSEFVEEHLKAPLMEDGRQRTLFNGVDLESFIREVELKARVGKWDPEVKALLMFEALSPEVRLSLEEMGIRNDSSFKSIISKLNILYPKKARGIRECLKLIEGLKQRVGECPMVFKERFLAIRDKVEYSFDDSLVFETFHENVFDKYREAIVRSEAKSIDKAVSVMATEDSVEHRYSFMKGVCSVEGVEEINSIKSEMKMLGASVSRIKHENEQCITDLREIRSKRSDLDKNEKPRDVILCPKSLEDFQANGYFCPTDPGILDNRTEVQYSARDPTYMYWNDHGLVFAPNQIGNEKQCLVLTIIGDTVIHLLGWKAKGLKLPRPLQEKYGIQGGMVKNYIVKYELANKWNYIMDGDQIKVFSNDGDLNTPDVETMEILPQPIYAEMLQFCPVSAVGETPVLYIDLLGCRLYPKNEFSRLYFDPKYNDPYTCLEETEWGCDDLTFTSNAGDLPENAATISLRLVANGLHSCRPLRRLPLTPPNRRQRLEWCRARSMWMTEWHRVVFSDESRFCLSSDRRRVRVWRRRGERSNPAAIVERRPVRQRGIMVWGAITYDSRSPLLRIQGTMTAQRYVDDVLRPVTLPYLQGVPNALYQQDNARPHTARISQQALQDVQMLPWPPYSPDLSPIEHVWDIIGRRLHALPQPRSEDELWQMVEREWRAIPQDAIRTLIDSLPRRVAACIAVRGGPTCY
ncbi:Transposase [Cordylochernes scorpioides]|uniref:Transposase n=1 Tax=Cordylochernes scorpioides TaxID=51811 RepID=A0ABY6K8G9_9ARAC|nr:Transposase [Cordylochernes scorpioides]